MGAAQGFRRFMLCTGYRGDLIEQFISSRTWPKGVEVRCVDTGLDTPTGGRIKQAGALLGERPFCATYSDGVANVDLLELVDCHRAHGGLATMTVVRPQLQFGIAQIDGSSRVRGFREKPRSEHWVNGGFFCFEQDSLAYIGDASVLEGEPLERLAADGQLHAFRHEGFWQCMDTFKDVVLLNDVWSAVRRPGGSGTDALCAVDRRLRLHRLRTGARPPRTRRRGDRAAARRELALGARDGEHRSKHQRGLGRCHPRPARRTRHRRPPGRHGLSPRCPDTRGHCPALATREWEVNVGGTWTVLEACRRLDVQRVVVAASHAALQPSYPYETSKAAADLIARSYWHAYGIPVATTRFSNVYGGGDLNRSRLIPEAVGAALARRPPILRSDGTPERDFQFVDDAVAAYLAIAEALDGEGARGEAFDAGGGRAYAVREVVELICRIAGSEVGPEIRGHGTPDGELDRQCVDTTKLRELTGWQPRVDLEEGLRRTVEWYRGHPAALG